MAEYWKYFVKSYAVLGYTYDADVHCPDCAVFRFGIDALDDSEPTVFDSEGNPIHPMFADQTDKDVCCSDCHTPLWEGV